MRWTWLHRAPTSSAKQRRLQLHVKPPAVLHLRLKQVQPAGQQQWIGRAINPATPPSAVNCKGQPNPPGADTNIVELLNIVISLLCIASRCDCLVWAINGVHQEVCPGCDDTAKHVCNCTSWGCRCSEVVGKDVFVCCNPSNELQVGLGCDFRVHLAGVK